MSAHGGKRMGAGRPKGSVKKSTKLDEFNLAMRADERVLHFAFCAKYAAAFFKISRSSVTLANSRFSRRFSAS